MYDDSGVYHHTYRYEEYSPEQVFDGFEYMLYTFCCECLGKDRPHYESSEFGREPRLCRHYHHTQTKTYRQDKIPLVVEEVFYPFQESRYDEYPQQKPEYKEETEFQYGQKHLAALYALSNGDCREQHHKQDDHYILYYQHPENGLCVVFGFNAEFVESPDNNNGARRCQHPAQKEAIHSAPTQCPAQKITCDDDDQYLHYGSDRSRSPHTHQFLETELEPKAEQQKYDTYLGKRLHIVNIGNGRHYIDIRTHQKTCNDVSEYERLF